MRFQLAAVTKNTSITLNVLPASTFHLGGQELLLTGGHVTVLANGATLDGGWQARLIRVTGGAHLTILDAHLTRGNTSGSGGALLVERGSVALERCVINESTAYFGGGIAIQTAASAGRLTDCSVSYCSVESNDNIRPRGGGVDVDGGVLTIAGSSQVSHCTVSSITAGGFGGGLHLSQPGGGNHMHTEQHASLTLLGTELYNNSVRTESGTPSGGGVVVKGGFFEMVGGRISDCKVVSSTTNNGGGFYKDSGVVQCGGTAVWQAWQAQRRQACSGAGGIVPQWCSGIVLAAVQWCSVPLC